MIIIIVALIMGVNYARVFVVMAAFYLFKRLLKPFQISVKTLFYSLLFEIDLNLQRESERERTKWYNSCLITYFYVLFCFILDAMQRVKNIVGHLITCI